MTSAPRYTVTVQEIEAEPLSVSQHTCLRVTGLPPERFLELVRAKAFPSARAGHDRIALLDDVRAWIRAQAAAPAPRKRRLPAAAPQSLEDIMARGGARKAG